MIQITDSSKCCGCTACANICPHNAITLQPDAMGFPYPTVSLEKCTDCGLCEKVCAFHKDYDKSLNLPNPEAYAARHKDIHEVETSRSGVAFIAISDWILEHGGVVYGAGYAEHFRVIHKRAETKEECNEFKGSKYVQSDLNDVFKQVKEDLKSGKAVLFSGTPCQTSGLNSYIGKTLRENLYLADIVCHGVPSPYIWRDYISYLEAIYNDRIYQVNFRNKQDFGWAAHKETYNFSHVGKKEETIFTKMFFQHVMCRKSCAVCPFTNIHRPSDITIGDFWGWEKTDAEINKDDKGVSLILINTAKGKTLFEQIKKHLITVQAKIENCLQPNLKHPLEESPYRDIFEQDYIKHGFKRTLEKYAYIGWKFKIKVLKRKINTAKCLLLKK